jgi:hypothetical protein
MICRLDHGVFQTVIASESEAIHFAAGGSMDCFVAIAPLRKRFAFVAGNDDSDS